MRTTRAGSTSPEKAARNKPRSRPRAPGSLRPLVGDAIYEAWLEMLRRLVPEGRTHRVAVVVAGMLQYAAAVVPRRQQRAPEKGSLAEALIDPEATHPDAFAYTPSDGPGLPLEDIVASLFGDGGVAHRRTNARGSPYSMIPHAVSEYLHWFDMPWE